MRGLKAARVRRGTLGTQVQSGFKQAVQTRMDVTKCIVKLNRVLQTPPAPSCRRCSSLYTFLLD